MFKKILLLALLVPMLVVLTAMDTAPSSPALPPMTAPVLKDQQLECLATNIYREAGWESDEGKLAVATVTMNRVGHSEFPDNVCDVVYQRNPRGCQFSWVCQKTSPMDSARYARSERIAQRVLYDNTRHRRLSRALFYHADYVAPLWASQMTPIVQIGAHIFYDPRKPPSENSQEGPEEVGTREQAETDTEAAPAESRPDSSENHRYLPYHPTL